MWRRMPSCSGWSQWTCVSTCTPMPCNSPASDSTSAVRSSRNSARSLRSSSVSKKGSPVKAGSKSQTKRSSAAPHALAMRAALAAAGCVSTVGSTTARILSMRLMAFGLQCLPRVATMVRLCRRSAAGDSVHCGIYLRYSVAAGQMYK